MAMPSYRRDAVLAALRERGPMTAHEVAEHLEMPHNIVRNTIGTTRNLRPGQLIRVVAYRPVIGRRARDEFVFAAQAGPDVERKPINMEKRRKERQARYRQKHSGTIKVRERVRNAKRRGAQPVINMWAGLVGTEMQTYMVTVAANTNSLAEAA